MRHYVTVTLTLLLVSACSVARVRQPTTARGPATGSGDTPLMVTRQLAAAGSTATYPLTQGDSALIARGKEIVSTICVACHTEQPPPKLAPPLAHVSNRYRMMLGQRDSALVRIAAWIKEPSKDRSLMPTMAIERFGLMAPLPLPEEQRLAAAAYLWSLSEGERGMKGMGGMDGMPGGRGRGMMHGQATPDTARTLP